MLPGMRLRHRGSAMHLCTYSGDYYRVRQCPCTTHDPILRPICLFAAWHPSSLAPSLAFEGAAVDAGHHGTVEASQARYEVPSTSAADSSVVGLLAI